MSPYQGSDELIRNKDSSGNEFLAVCLWSTRGRSVTSSANTNDYLDLEVMNSKSNSLRITIHLEYLPPRVRRDSMYCMGLVLDTIVVVHIRM